MKVELKPFQEAAVKAVLEELADARPSAARGRLQAVVLSAPTGSGKTITIAGVIDQMFAGGEGHPARPGTVFLWLSDSPELNAQSKGKLLGACDHLPFHRMVTVDSESFDEDRLYPGHVYFINTQLLGRDKRLTQGGDKRRFTFWQTVANTVAWSPEDFVLVIDEAHRGAAVNERHRRSIMQKFIIGSDDDGLPPVPIVLGMSATPQRFTELLGNASRVQRPVVITADDVRSSGLLKDLILVHNPRGNVESDLTLLEHAAGRWQEFSVLWKAYCDREKERTTVRPILVVQVEDGTGERSLSKTNLSEVIQVIERQTGPLAINEVVHCFTTQTDTQIGNRIVRYLEPSRVQDDSLVKVVLFKTALSTGWDCPRAEVMMSFRRAHDHTSIAQLVGRMIRTPLARRVESDEVLNTVELFLPRFDAAALDAVLNALRSPEEGVPTRVEIAAVPYARNPAFGHVFTHLATLPSFFVERVPKMGDLKRVLRLAGMLVHDGIDQDADEHVRDVLTTRLRGQRDQLAADAKDWIQVVREGGEIEVDVSEVAIGLMSVSGRRTTKLTLSEENIDELFDAAGRALASREGLHRSYWKRYHDHSKPNEAKLELFAVVKNPAALEDLAAYAREEFDRLWKKHAAAIQRLAAAERARFQLLVRASGRPVQQAWELPEQIVEKPDGGVWVQHLYCDGRADFMAKLNEWEKAFLAAEMGRSDFVCWLRNLPRREWAFCVPYDLAGIKPFYPDFIVVRRSGTGYLVDILEPHDDSRMDTWAKAKGLAMFADDHGLQFGRLLIGRKRGEDLQVVDLNVPLTREAARRMQSPNDLDSLFRRDS